MNAAGVWADEVRAFDEGAHAATMRPAKGVHITVPWDRVRNEIAMFVPVPSDGRSSSSSRGETSPTSAPPTTTTTATSTTPSAPPTTSTTCCGRSTRRSSTRSPTDDVIGDVGRVAPAPRHRGVGEDRRPLAAPRHPRVGCGRGDHHRREAHHLPGDGPQTRSTRSTRCSTGTTASAGRSACPLTGARGYRPPRPTRRRSSATSPALRHRGRGAARARSPTIPRSVQPLVPGLPYVKAEAVYAVREEMAGSLADVLDRRTRCRMLDRAATAAAAESVARLLAPEWGWDDATIAAAVAAYRADLESERGAATSPVGARHPDRRPTVTPSVPVVTRDDPGVGAHMLRAARALATTVTALAVVAVVGLSTVPTAGAATTCTQDWHPASPAAYLHADGTPTTPPRSMPPAPTPDHRAVPPVLRRALRHVGLGGPESTPSAVATLGRDVVLTAATRACTRRRTRRSGSPGSPAGSGPPPTTRRCGCSPGNGMPVDIELRVVVGALALRRRDRRRRSTGWGTAYPGALTGAARLRAHGHVHRRGPGRARRSDLVRGAPTTCRSRGATRSRCATTSPRSAACSTPADARSRRSGCSVGLHVDLSGLGDRGPHCVLDLLERRR